MGLQKYRADVSAEQRDGAIVWSARWMGGDSLAKIVNCRAVNLHGTPRLTVYIAGEADSYFSIPAKARYLGVTLNGYVTAEDDGNLVFHHCYY